MMHVKVEENDPLAPRICNTASLQAIALDAQDRGLNRQVDAREIGRTADPEGVHVLTIRLPYHNGLTAKGGPHHRCSVYVKIFGSDEPTEMMMDVSESMWGRLTKASDWLEEE